MQCEFSANHKCLELEGIFEITHSMFHGILISHDSSFKQGSTVELDWVTHY